MLGEQDIHPATDAMLAAADAVARDLAAGDVGGEEDFSGQFIGRLKERFENFVTANVRWRVAAALEERDVGDVRTSVRFSGRQLGSKGPGSEESWIGADLVLVLEVETRDFKIRKGVFVQAKRLDAGKKLSLKTSGELRTQCKRMLDITASSFVFLYRAGGLTVLPASAVEAIHRRDLHALSMYHPRWFFQDFLVCWIGDPRIEATDRESLAVLRALSRARNAVLLRADETS